MDRKLDRAARELGVKGEHLFEANRRKRLLANSILIKIRDELASDPETEEFTYPVGSAVAKLERFVLTHYPWDIADQIRPDHSITLSLNESIEPPELTVTIGQPARKS